MEALEFLVDLVIDGNDLCEQEAELFGSFRPLLLARGFRTTFAQLAALFLHLPSEFSDPFLLFRILRFEFSDTGNKPVTLGGKCVTFARQAITLVGERLDLRLKVQVCLGEACYLPGERLLARNAPVELHVCQCTTSHERQQEQSTEKLKEKRCAISPGSCCDFGRCRDESGLTGEECPRNLRYFIGSSIRHARGRR